MIESSRRSYFLCLVACLAISACGGPGNLDSSGDESAAADNGTSSTAPDKLPDSGALGGTSGTNDDSSPSDTDSNSDTNSGDDSQTEEEPDNSGSNPASTNTAQLTWIAPNDNDVSGFRIYYGTLSGQYQQALGAGIDAGSATSYTLSELVAGTRYYFAVSAYDTSGNESPYSIEVSKLID